MVLALGMLADGNSTACNGTIVSDPEMGEVIQLQGDQRKDVQEFLVDKKEGLELDTKLIKVRELLLYLKPASDRFVRFMASKRTRSRPTKPSTAHRQAGYHPFKLFLLRLLGPMMNIGRSRWGMSVG